MQLYNNDKVRFIDSAGEGVIVGFKGSFIAVVLDEHGFELDIHTEKLVKISDELVDDLLKTRVPDQTIFSKNNIQIKAKSKPNKPSEKEIDLHIENLLESHSSLSNYEIVTIQINALKKELNKVIKKRSPKTIIAIHGVGQGVLKSEIYALLKDYDSFYLKDASYEEYGYGATEIILRG